jgi:uncharacterized membrane protein YGL010W
MRKIDLLLDEYGSSHQNHLNKSIHWICVPLIFFSIVGLLWSIPSGYFQSLLPGEAGKFINWGTIALALALVYYVSLSIPLFLGMLFIAICFSAICYFIEASGTPLWLVCVIIFFLAWIGQFYGHKVEGKKPSFFKDLQFLLIGPAWLMSFIFKSLKVSY